MNHVILTGRLGADPEKAEIRSDQTKVEMSVAVRDGKQSEDAPTWIYVTVWGNQADVVHRLLRKGSEVAVHGRISVDKWTNKDGERRSKTYVTANRVEFMGSKPHEPSKSNFKEEDIPF